MIKYFENDIEVTQERVDELILQEARADWVIEGVECIKDTVRELEKLKDIIIAELASKGVFGNDTRENMSLIYSGFVFSLLGVAIFSDQFKRKKKPKHRNEILDNLKWESFDCSIIDTSVDIKLSRYMRNFFSHVRKGRQGFLVSIKDELDYGKSCTIDILKMTNNEEIRLTPIEDIGIEDITHLLVDRVYTNLRGQPTGETYIDLYKFTESMSKELYSIWRAFVTSNKCELDNLSQQTGAVIMRINEDDTKKKQDINSLEGIKFLGIDDRLRKKLNDALEAECEVTP